MSGDVDPDIPGSGAVFTFGKSKFADNVPSHFFIKNDPIVDLACGDQHTAVVCQNGRVFTFGSNEWGQLGLGHSNPIYKPSCLKSIKLIKCTNVALGRAHTLIRTADGELYTCGANSEGQLGLSDTEPRHTPQLVESIHSVIAVAAGSNHSAAITGTGDVYLWGSNAEGQLGQGKEMPYAALPTKLELLEPTLYVATGYYHTLLLTENGSMWSMGEGDGGRLGLGHEESSYTPQRVIVPESVTFKTLAAGGSHSVALDEEGELYVWGSNEFGQLGQESDGVTGLMEPTLCLLEKKFIQISAGQQHSAFVTEDGGVLVCGETRHGKLGTEWTKQQFVTRPTPIPKFSSLNVMKIACGGCHTAVLAAPKNQPICQIFVENSESVQSAAGKSLPPLVKKVSNSNLLNPPDQILSPPLNHIKPSARHQNSTAESRISISDGQVTLNYIIYDFMESENFDDSSNSNIHSNSTVTIKAEHLSLENQTNPFLTSNIVGSVNFEQNNKRLYYYQNSDVSNFHSNSGNESQDTKAEHSLNKTKLELQKNLSIISPKQNGENPLFHSLNGYEKPDVLSMSKISDCLYETYSQCREDEFSSGGDAVSYYKAMGRRDIRLNDFTLKEHEESDRYSISSRSGGEEIFWTDNYQNNYLSNVEKIVNDEISTNEIYFDKTDSILIPDSLTSRLNETKLLKYEIPKFYVLRSSSITSASEDEFERNTRENTNNPKSMLGKNNWRKKRRQKKLSKFTVPNLCEEVARRLEGECLKRKNAIRRKTQEKGQGDPPWILILDGSDEDEDEETIRTSSACGLGTAQAWENHYDNIETLEDHEPTELEKENNAKNAAHHQNIDNSVKKVSGQSEGKISRFFSRLRKSPSINSADIKEIQNGVESNGKDASDNIIISLEDNQSSAENTSKKSKLCTIL